MTKTLILAGITTAWLVGMTSIGLSLKSLTDDNVAARSHRASVRESDGSVLGVVGPGFTPLQNAKAFEWFRPFLDSGAATIEAAGSLRAGKRVWILAALNGASDEVVPGDRVQQYILLAHAHDGSLAIRAGFSAVRVVCQNTLSASVAAGDVDKRLVKIHHRKGMDRALENVRETMDLATAELRAVVDQGKILAGKACDDSNLARYVRAVFAGDSKTDDEKAVPRIVNEIAPLMTNAPGADPGSMWGAYNAVTRFLTHERGRTADARVNSNWFGGGAKLTERAMDVALQFAADAPDFSRLLEKPRGSAVATQLLTGVHGFSEDFASLLSKTAKFTQPTV